MRKIFSLRHEKIKTPRLVDSIKHEVKKYLKRERNKKLPPDADFWDFDCKYGNTKDEAQTVHLSTLNKHIDSAYEQELESFYIEILAKPGYRNVNVNEDIDEDEL